MMERCSFRETFSMPLSSAPTPSASPPPAKTTCVSASGTPAAGINEQDLVPNPMPALRNVEMFTVA